MAIGRFLGEAVSEGFIFKMVSNVWNSFFYDKAKGALSTATDKILNPKTMEDEAVFSPLLAIAKMAPGKKTMFRKVLHDIEKNDKRKKTRHARNFRIIVSLDPLGASRVVKSKKNKDTEEEEEKRDLTLHPGKQVLEEIGESCTTEDEFRVAVIATGAMQDYHLGMFERVEDAFEYAYPKILEILENYVDPAAGKLGGEIASFTRWVKNQYQEKRDRCEERKRRRSVNWWNWLNLRLWFQQFMDLR